MLLTPFFELYHEYGRNPGKLYFWSATSQYAESFFQSITAGISTVFQNYAENSSVAIPELKYILCEALATLARDQKNCTELLEDSTLRNRLTGLFSRLLKCEESLPIAQVQDKTTVDNFLKELTEEITRLLDCSSTLSFQKAINFANLFCTICRLREAGTIEQIKQIEQWLLEKPLAPLTYTNNETLMKANSKPKNELPKSYQFICKYLIKLSPNARARFGQELKALKEKVAIDRTFPEQDRTQKFIDRLTARTEPLREQPKTSITKLVIIAMQEEDEPNYTTENIFLFSIWLHEGGNTCVRRIIQELFLSALSCDQEQHRIADTSWEPPLETLRTEHIPRLMSCDSPHSFQKAVLLANLYSTIIGSNGSPSAVLEAIQNWKAFTYRGEETQFTFFAEETRTVPGSKSKTLAFLYDFEKACSKEIQKRALRDPLPGGLLSQFLAFYEEQRPKKILPPADVCTKLCWAIDAISLTSADAADADADDVQEAQNDNKRTLLYFHAIRTIILEQTSAPGDKQRAQSENKTFRKLLEQLFSKIFLLALPLIAPSREQTETRTEKKELNTPLVFLNKLHGEITRLLGCSSLLSFQKALAFIALYDQLQKRPLTSANIVATIKSWFKQPTAQDTQSRAATEGDKQIINQQLIASTRPGKEAVATSYQFICEQLANLSVFETEKFQALLFLHEETPLKKMYATNVHFSTTIKDFFDKINQKMQEGGTTLLTPLVYEALQTGPQADWNEKNKDNIFNFCLHRSHDDLMSIMSKILLHALFIDEANSTMQESQAAAFLKWLNSMIGILLKSCLDSSYDSSKPAFIQAFIIIQLRNQMIAAGSAPDLLKTIKTWKKQKYNQTGLLLLPIDSRAYLLVESEGGNTVSPQYFFPEIRKLEINLSVTVPDNFAGEHKKAADAIEEYLEENLCLHSGQKPMETDLVEAKAEALIDLRKLVIEGSTSGTDVNSIITAWLRASINIPIPIGASQYTITNEALIKQSRSDYVRGTIFANATTETFDFIDQLLKKMAPKGKPADELSEGPLNRSGIHDCHL